jgi:hypothetical protein
MMLFSKTTGKKLRPFFSNIFGARFLKFGIRRGSADKLERIPAALILADGNGACPINSPADGLHRRG